MCFYFRKSNAADYIGLLWQNIGKKAALWMPVIALPQILVLAWLMNLLV